MTVLDILNEEKEKTLKEIVRSKIALRIMEKYDPTTVIGYNQTTVNDQVVNKTVTAKDVLRQKKNELEASETRYVAIEEMIKDESKSAK